MAYEFAEIENKIICIVYSFLSAVDCLKIRIKLWNNKNGVQNIFLYSYYRILNFIFHILKGFLRNKLEEENRCLFFCISFIVK